MCSAVSGRAGHLITERVLLHHHQSHAGSLLPPNRPGCRSSRELETRTVASAQGHWKGWSSAAAISQFSFCFTCWFACSFLVSWLGHRLSKRLRSCGQLRDRCRELGLEKFGQTEGASWHFHTWASSSNKAAAGLERS